MRLVILFFRKGHGILSSEIDEEEKKIKDLAQHAKEDTENVMKPGEKKLRTSAEVTAAYADKVAHSKRGSITLPQGLVPPEDMDRDELLRWEESITSPNRGIISTKDFSDPEDIYLALVARIRKYHPNTDLSMIDKAYNYAAKCHVDQKRKSGEPYIIHPLSVALILADLEMDKETIAAGLLHDVVEDTPATDEDIAREFSPEVARLVEGVTKLTNLSYDYDKVEVQAENLRKMFLAMAKDIRVIIIKLADRLHNMRTLKYMRPEKQKEKSLETQEIYAPLAQRLGISKLKIELDDLALKYLEPEAYYGLVEAIASMKSERDAYVQNLVDIVKKAIDDAEIEGEVSGRAKHIFSVYRKMVSQHKTLDQIYDLFAVRIIVNDVKDCYASLGVIHELFTPIPGRFKDYIAMPKPNMYQSLHTTVIGPDGTPFEVQIRTYEMHRTAEYGIAAHWKYKESGEGATVVGEEAKLSWLRQILEWQQDMSDDKEFMSLLKSDLNLFSDTVFCFTPQGDVKNLPSGSTPIDFAYSVHTAVGNTMVGAKVNGKLVPIDYKIQNGDRVEVITSQNSKGPSKDWLNFVKSTQAKNKILQWYRNQSKEGNIEKGRDLLNNNAKGKNIPVSLLNRPEYQECVERKYGYHDWDSVLAAVGQNSLKEGTVVNRMYSEYLKDHPVVVTDEDIVNAHNGTIENAADADTKIARGTKAAPQIPTGELKKTSGKNRSGVMINGIPDVAVRFSRCCNPLPGDEIVGFITRGRGITIHRTDCLNVINLPEFERQRLIEAEWEPDFIKNKKNEVFKTCLEIYGNNRTGLLVDISKVFTERNIDLIQVTSRIAKNGIATVTITFNAKNKEEVSELSSKISQIESVLDIKRSAG